MAKPATTTTKSSAKDTKSVQLPATTRRTEVAQIPKHLVGKIEEHAGKGVSNKASDVGIPFLSILQDLSPQVKKRDEKYVDGAEVGMIFNTQSKEIFSGEDGVLFVPAFFKSALVEWVPRDKGGGYVAEYHDEHPIMGTTTRPDRKKAPILPNGNSLVLTKYYFGLFIKDDGVVEPAVIGMSSSGLKVSREWQRMFKLFKLPTGETMPSFCKAYRLRTKLTANNAKQEYFTWDISVEDWTPSEVFDLAVLLEQDCAKGAVQASRPDDSSIAGQGDEEVL